MRDRDILLTTINRVTEILELEDMKIKDPITDLLRVHDIKNLKVLKEYLETHKCEINDFIEADKRNRG